jgi:hypothetical protein
MDLPGFVKQEFGPFYKAMFAEQVKREDMRAVFLEYAWDMGWCDPCAADPLSNEELTKLGVSWLDAPAQITPGPGAAAAPRVAPPPLRRRPITSPAGSPVFVTRLHVRYDAAHFPEDLAFQETADRTNFQGRYVLRHPWKGESTCEAARIYRDNLKQRQEKEAQSLASLTGWDVNDVRKKMGTPTKITEATPRSFWDRLFGR